MVINKALLKYGYSEFKLEILENCDAKDLVKKEQYYMDILNPEYNVLNTAYSSLGYKHTPSCFARYATKGMGSVARGRVQTKKKRRNSFI